ncbi:GNAT family N-acetyltransferase [Minwuia sp.]|uniref:GNAT family N-acetyltransferase n=1 Tax=Minwuia sp. TaxID=2493630 RepID=UPI003A928B8A
MTVSFRTATEADVPAIVAMLADDTLGQGREDQTDLAPYLMAFRDMEAQGGNGMILAVDGNGDITGCLQLTLIPGLSRGGALRGQIESVRVAASARGQKIGEKLIGHAIEQAQAAGATLIQLTSDLKRTDAIRFYERLGFVNSHAGMKLEVRREPK